MKPFRCDSVPAAMPSRTHHGVFSRLAELCHLRLILLLLFATTPVARAELNAVAVSPDGKIVVAGGDAKTIYLWPLAEDGLIRALPAGETVFSLSWAPDRRTIAAGTRHGCQIWRRAEADYQREAILQPERTVLATAIAPDNTALAFGVEGSGTFYFYDLASKEQVGELFERSNLTSGMAYSPSGLELASAGNSFSEWNVRAGSLPKAPPVRPSVEDAVAKSGPNRLWTAGVPGFVEYAAAVAYDADGKLLAGVNGTGGHGPRSGGKTLRVWEPKTGRTLRTGFATGMGCVVFLASGDLVTGSDDGKLRVWSVGNGRVTREWVGHKGEVRGLAAIPNSPNFVSAGQDDHICVWNPENGTRVRSIACGPK